MMVARQMIETFQCPGCVHGDNTKCGAFKLHELKQVTSNDSGEKFATPFCCKNHSTSQHIGGYVNIGLPIPFARVQYRETREEVRTNIRLHLAPPPEGIRLWDGFNVPVWGMERGGFLFVRTYCPRTDQSYVDVIQGGTFALLDNTTCINIDPIADRIPL